MYRGLARELIDATGEANALGQSTRPNEGAIFYRCRCISRKYPMYAMG
jgi:hypothetical protein